MSPPSAPPADTSLLVDVAALREAHAGDPEVHIRLRDTESIWMQTRVALEKKPPPAA